MLPKCQFSKRFYNLKISRAASSTFEVLPTIKKQQSIALGTLILKIAQDKQKIDFTVASLMLAVLATM